MQASPGGHGAPGSPVVHILRGSHGGSSEAAEGGVDAEVQPALHGVVLVVRPEDTQMSQITFHGSGQQEQLCAAEASTQVRGTH